MLLNRFYALQGVSGRWILVLLLLFFKASVFPAGLNAQYSHGNIIIGDKTSGRLAKRIPLTLFPHWIHSMWYTCKACHEGVFPMKSGGSGIVMKKIENREQCGVCHNGDLAFGPEKNCGRCHQSRDTSRQVRFAEPQAVSVDELDKIYKKLNIRWFPRKLKNGELFFDYTGQVDFERMISHDDIIRPKGFITERKDEQPRDNLIVFSPKSDSMDSVIFDHAVHSGLISCNSCHEKVFVSKLGESRVFMKDIASGKSCGLCHNGIAFGVDNCKNCHVKGAEKGTKRVLYREKAPGG